MKIKTSMQAGEQFNCQVCNKLVTLAYRSKVIRKYCGVSCAGKAKAEAAKLSFNCKHCNKQYFRRIGDLSGGYTGAFCSTQCNNKHRSGDKNHRFKTGKYVNGNGYVNLSIEGRAVLEHRHVMEKPLGRALLRAETVHHINGDRTDNRLENLELWTSSHPSGQRVIDKIEWAKQILTLYSTITI